MITTTETVRKCPICDNETFTRDYEREETYCNKCGLVITSAFQYVGLEKIHNTIPYSAPSDARKGVHISYRRREDKGKYDNRGLTNYRHNLTNKQLMRKGI